MSKVSNKIQNLETSIGKKKIGVCNHIANGPDFDVEADWIGNGITNQSEFELFLQNGGLFTFDSLSFFNLTGNRIKANWVNASGALQVSDIDVTKVNIVKNINDLNGIYFGNNLLTKIEGFERLNSLSAGIFEIIFPNNQITKIENIDNFKSETNNIQLNGNNISVLENLQGFALLQILLLEDNQIDTIITNALNGCVNIANLSIQNNQLTTSQFNNLNSWATTVANGGTINASNNIDNFNTSTTYTTLLGKGWTIIT